MLKALEPFLRTYIYKQRLGQVIRGQVPQTTPLATGRLDVDLLLKQLQQLKNEGKKYVFITGFLATDRETGKIHQKGDRETFRVGINLKIADDLENQQAMPTMSEKFPQSRQEAAPQEEYNDSWDSNDSEGEDIDF